MTRFPKSPTNNCTCDHFHHENCLAKLQHMHFYCANLETTGGVPREKSENPEEVCAPDEAISTGRPP